MWECLSHRKRTQRLCRSSLYIFLCLFVPWRIWYVCTLPSRTSSRSGTSPWAWRRRATWPSYTPPTMRPSQVLAGQWLGARASRVRPPKPSVAAIAPSSSSSRAAPQHQSGGGGVASLLIREGWQQAGKVLRPYRGRNDQKGGAHLEGPCALHGPHGASYP